MGTSVSNRSPNTPRWRAAQASYVQGLPLDRIAVEVLRASEGWVSALTSAAVGEYVTAVAAAYGDFGEQLRHSDRPERAIQAAVDDVRRTALASGADISAVALAERAFQRTLLRTARSTEAFLDSTPAQAAEAWASNRGRAQVDLVQTFVADLASQFASHVVSRDSAGLVGHERLPTASAARALADRVSSDIAESITASFTTARLTAAGADWRRAIEQVFSRALQTPVSDDG
jgi:hypothetical protein